LVFLCYYVRFLTDHHVKIQLAVVVLGCLLLILLVSFVNFTLMMFGRGIFISSKYLKDFFLMNRYIVWGLLLIEIIMFIEQLFFRDPFGIYLYFITQSFCILNGRLSRVFLNNS
jgi:hypothetical protein